MLKVEVTLYIQVCRGLISLTFSQLLAEASGRSTDGTENMERVLQEGTHLILLKDLQVKKHLKEETSYLEMFL